MAQYIIEGSSDTSIITTFKTNSSFRRTASENTMYKSRKPPDPSKSKSMSDLLKFATDNMNFVVIGLSTEELDEEDEKIEYSCEEKDILERELNDAVKNASEPGFAMIIVGDKLLEFIDGEIGLNLLKELIDKIIANEKEHQVKSNYVNEAGLLSVALRNRFNSIDVVKLQFISYK